MDAETKQYNFTEKRAAQLEKARLKRWELHNKEKAEPQEEEKGALKKGSSKKYIRS